MQAPDETKSKVKAGLFPTFFLSGYECSTFLWKDKGRRDLVAETQHLDFLDVDHGFLGSVGIAVSREGIPWPSVDRGGKYDFSCIDPIIDSLERHKLLPIWDLCHYGYPDDADPFAEDFPQRFASYAKAAAAYVVPRLRGPHFFTPVNEITFFPTWRESGGGPHPSAQAGRSASACASSSAAPPSKERRRSARSIAKRGWCTSILW